MTLQQWLQDLELAEEVATELGGVIAELEAGQAASVSFPASTFGHEYTVAIAFTPVAK